jgi:hypothetical protein
MQTGETTGHAKDVVDWYSTAVTQSSCAKPPLYRLRVHPVFHLLLKRGKMCASVLNTTSCRGRKSVGEKSRYRYLSVSA